MSRDTCELCRELREGTYETTVEEPLEGRVVLLEQDLELAISVTKAELRAAEPPDTGRDFVAAVIRIGCATVIGALVGAPLGALAAQEDILRKVAEAAVVTGLGATTAEVIYPISVKLTRGHEEPAELHGLSSYRSALDAVRDLQHETGRGALPRTTDRSMDIDESAQLKPPDPPQESHPPTPLEPGSGL
jgi:hypothetical protein